MVANMEKEKRGWMLVLLAYTVWGILPGYWKMLASVSPLEVLSHRIIWSALFLGALLSWKGRLRASLRNFKDPNVMKVLGTSSLLISGNWLLYVWALGKGYFIEAGLGYYLCPLVILLLGRFVLDERLTILQTIAVSMVAAGVATKVAATGELPIVAMGLAVSFALYTLVRKTTTVNPLEGLFIETVLAGIPALFYAGYLLTTNHASFLSQSLSLDLLLVASGAITALPLLWLATGAQSTPLKLVGMLQFIAPTLTTVIGIYYGDPLKLSDVPVYALILGGIATYLLPERDLTLIKEAA